MLTSKKHGQDKPGSGKMRDKLQMGRAPGEMASSVYLLQATSNEKDKLCSGSYKYYS